MDLLEIRRTNNNSMGEKKYSVILADPPWHFDVYSKKGEVRSAEKHYPTMDIEDIKALPVDSIADKDCTLFLWVTFPCLMEGLEVIKAWGFAYKTVAFVWVKQNKKADSLFWGMGYWTRSNVEMCILATKGRPKRVDAGVREIAFTVFLSFVRIFSVSPSYQKQNHIFTLENGIRSCYNIFAFNAERLLKG